MAPRLVTASQTLNLAVFIITSWDAQTTGDSAGIQDERRPTRDINN